MLIGTIGQYFLSQVTFLVPSPVLPPWSSTPPLSSCELLHTCLVPSVVHAPLSSSKMLPPLN